jgi:hypothetical protein
MSSLTTTLEGLGLDDDQSLEANAGLFLLFTVQDCNPTDWDGRGELNCAKECENGLEQHTKDETSWLLAMLATACMTAFSCEMSSKFAVHKSPGRETSPHSGGHEVLLCLDGSQTRWR